jgi:hypothetical protein
MSAKPPVRTTLYELVKAVSEEVSPKENCLVAGIVLHMLATRRIRFVGDLENLKEALRHLN